MNSSTRKCFATGFSGMGRVYVWYGGGSNGPYVQPDGFSGYPLVTEYAGLGGSTEKFGFSTLSNTPSQTSDSPCLANGGITCTKIHVIAEDSTNSFGQSITSIPLQQNASCGSKPVSALAVRALNNSGNGIIHLYLPKCFRDGNSDYSGLTTPSLFLQSGSGQIPPSSGFGATILGGGISGSKRIMSSNTVGTSTLLAQMIATDSVRGMVYSFPIVTDGTTVKFQSLPSSPAYNPEVDFFKLGGRINDYSGSLQPLSPQSARFGISSALLGDLNSDGFMDIGINVASMHRRESSSTYDYQGGIMIFFGGSKGLQTHRESNKILLNPKKEADCYLVKKQSGLVTSVCDPQLLFAPQPSLSISEGQGAYELTYLNPYSYLSTGSVGGGGCSIPNSRNECLGSFLFGVPGRDGPLPSGNLSRILQGGAFYVQP